jgi:hypothetical protein
MSLAEEHVKAGKRADFVDSPVFEKQKSKFKAKIVESGFDIKSNFLLTISLSRFLQPISLQSSPAPPPPRAPQNSRMRGGVQEARIAALDVVSKV